MTYCVVECDEQAKMKRINVLFKTRSEAELSAAMLRKLHPACRYEVDRYVPDPQGAHLPESGLYRETVRAEKGSR